MFKNNLQNYLTDLSINPKLMAFHNSDKVESMKEYGLSQKEIDIVNNQSADSIKNYLTQNSPLNSIVLIHGWAI